MTTASLPFESSWSSGSSGPLVGRDRELTAVRRHLEHPSRPCTVIVLEGAAGIGKTALAARIVRDAARLKWTVLSGAAPADPGAFGAFVELFGPTDLLGLLPGTEWPDCAAARQQLYRRVRDGLSGPCAGRGLVLVLDDVEHADADSIGLLVALVRHPPAVPTVIVLCCRTDRLPAPLDRDLAGRDVNRVRLAPLDAESVTALCGSSTARRRQALLSASGGNPRYLRSLSGLSTAAIGDLNAPVESTLAGRGCADAEIIAELRGLPEIERQVLGTAALLGPDVDVELVTAVAGLPIDAVVAAVDALAARDILTIRDERLVFSHPLVRAAAYRLGRPAWRTVAHRRALAELVDRGARRHELAPHVAACAQIGDRAAALLLAEAARATLRREPATAARWLEVALHVLPGEDTARRDDLLVLLARAHTRVGRSAAAAELLHELSESRRTATDVGLLLAQCERSSGHIDEAAALLRGTLTRSVADPSTTMAVQLELAGLDILRGRAPEDLVALSSDPDPTVSRALRAAAACITAIASSGQAGPVVPSSPVGRAGLLVDGLHEDELSEITGHLHLLAWSEFHVDHLDEAARHIDRARSAATRSGLLEAAPCLQIVRSAVAARRGSLELALQSAGEAEEIATELGFADYRRLAAAARLLPTLWRGGPLAVQALLARMPDLTSVVSPWARSIAAMWTAEVLIMTSKADAAASAAAIGCQAGAALGDPQQARMLALTALAEVQRGDLTAAATAAGSARALAQRSGRASQLAAADLATARVALASGDHGAATSAARSGLQWCERAGTPLVVGQARLLLAEVALAAGDHDTAQPELAEAKRTFESLGATWLGLLATNVQRRIGSSVPRSVTGVDGLSRREHEIAALLCEGLTNKVIADRLVLSVRTVDTHVARILGKLGVSSRAAVARRLGV